MSPQALVSQMNRATAEVQKTLSEEEGLAPILAWIKALVDEVLADEFDPGLAFTWSPTGSVDPEAQERMLSSYTSRGILTLNEARAALGRTPLADKTADAPLVLTAALVRLALLPDGERPARRKRRGPEPALRSPMTPSPA